MRESVEQEPVFSTGFVKPVKGLRRQSPPAIVRGKHHCLRLICMLRAKKTHLAIDMKHAHMRSLFTFFGVDRATVFGVLTRIWGLGSAAITLILIASRFSSELQGYYYTFSSILALQVFVELGLGQVILQFSSHEWSRLSLDGERRIVGDPDSLSRLLSIGRFATRWFCIAGAVAAVGLGGAGLIFFTFSPQVGVNWASPWLVLCILTGLNLCFSPLWSLLDGCNQVAETYRFRFISGLMTTITIWISILGGAELWTASFSLVVNIICSVIFLLRRYRKFLMQFLPPVKGPSVKWREEMLPLQWRIALSWLSGYLFTSLFTPVVFRFQGAVAAGQIGMSWGLVSALSSISVTMVLTKTPQFGMLVANKEYKKLDNLVLRSGIASVLVAVCGAIGIEGLVYMLYSLNHPFATRLLSPLPTCFFLIATILMQVSQTQSAYLRAHKKEPMMGLSVAIGLLTSAATILLDSRYGPVGIAAGYFVVVALVALPGSTIIWVRCRKAWHSPNNVPEAPIEKVGTLE
jgi:O-antigen/teichoic acid export membrane protein